MDIYLYQNLSEQNALDKSTALIGTLSGALKESTDLLNPVILIEGDITATVATTNYIYIPSFKRYYFLTGLTSVRTGLYQIEMHVDVLTTYRDGIRKNEALISRQENEWNMMIPDNQQQVGQKQIITQQAFPNAFSGEVYELIVQG